MNLNELVNVICSRVNDVNRQPLAIYLSSNLIDITRKIKHPKTGFVGSMQELNGVPIKEDESLPIDQIRVEFEI